MAVQKMPQALWRAVLVYTPVPYGRGAEVSVANRPKYRPQNATGAPKIISRRNKFAAEFLAIFQKMAGKRQNFLKVVVYTQKQCNGLLSFFLLLSAKNLCER
jgi:hypothetical protein